MTVLVIEDNIDVADSTARFLRVGAGFDVKVAYDGMGMTGVRMALADRPAAVVCDISLPRLHGLDVGRQLGRLSPKPLLIAVTAFDGAYSEDLARAAGFDHYLVKPADPFRIEQLVRDHAGPAGPGA